MRYSQSYDTVLNSKICPYFEYQTLENFIKLSVSKK